MPDNIYESFNYTSYDESEFSMVEEALTELERKKIKNLLKKKVSNNSKKKFLKIAALLAVFIVASTYTITYADSIPIIKDIKKKFYAPESYAKYSKDINSVISYKGYTVSVHDILYDNNFLIYSYTISKDNGEPLDHEDESKFTVGVGIDEKYLPKNAGYGGSIFNRVKDSDNEVSYFSYWVIKPLHLDDKIEVEIDIRYEGDIKKTLRLELDKTQLNPSNKEIKLDKEIKIPEGSIYLDTVSFTPFGAVFISENRGGWDFEDSDPYYYAWFDETGRQLSLPTQGSQPNYEKKTTTIIKETTSAEYKGHKNITIKTYDSRTGKEVEGSAVTFPIPDLN